MFRAFHLPLNKVSFGSCSISFLRELYSENQEPANICCIGQPDLGAQNLDKPFAEWLQSSINDFGETHDRDTPIFKLWHIDGSLEQLSHQQCLFTFYELDQPTKLEVNILKNQESVLVSSEYTRDIFRSCGLKNIEYVPLGFDSRNFYRTGKEYHTDRITFGIGGKFENRKHHVKAIRSWLNKYGNNKDYFLNCAIFNPFLSAEDNQRLVNEITQGKKFFNIQFLAHMEKNDVYNEFLNSNDIFIGASGGEGWGLPEFQSVAIGKHAVIMDAHGYKGWANKENACLFPPNSKKPAYDNMFFHQGRKTNQGNIFDFAEEDFIKACEESIGRYKNCNINDAGINLQKDFSMGNFVKKIKDTYLYSMCRDYNIGHGK